MENNLEFLCGIYDILEEKINNELDKIAKINPIKIDCTEGIDKNYFLTYNNEDVALYGMYNRTNKTYIDVIYVNGENVHTCTSLSLDKFNIEDKRYIAGYIDDIMKNH